MLPQAWGLLLALSLARNPASDLPPAGTEIDSDSVYL